MNIFTDGEVGTAEEENWCGLDLSKMLVKLEQKKTPAVGTEAVARTDREEPELCDGNERYGGLQADGPAAKPNRPKGKEERRMENE